MSGRSDLRMYVEHLFVGRTLDAETIELKEEIYGNLVARFDDYVAQGMGEGEAYAKTCEAVTSLDDVMGEGGDVAGAASAVGGAEDAGAVGGNAWASAPAPADPATFDEEEARLWQEGAGPTTVLTPPVAPSPTTFASSASAPKRWSAGKIAAVVVGALAIVGIAGFIVFNLLRTPSAPDDYRDQTSQNVEQVDQPDDTTYVDETKPEDTTTTDQTTDQTDQTDPTGTQGPGAGSGQGTGSQNGSGNKNGAPAQSGTGPTSEVQSLAPDTLEGYVGTTLSDGARITELARALPLGSYLTEAKGDAATGTLTLTYQYEDRDYVAHDDDHIDRALVFDVAALMCTMSDVNTVSIVEIEDDGWDYDRDLYVFERSSVEGFLGVALTPDQLTASSWSTLRDTVMSEHCWDPIWERAERD